MTAVAILDRVTLPADEARPWLDRMRNTYAPGAEQRGMHLRGTWSGHVGADAVEVCVLWELPDVAAFWTMRAAALADPSVAAWWDATDALALDRHRRVYEADALS
ncbi:MAG: NIPSNAP family protein [Acidimicrobiia bacterium]